MKKISIIIIFLLLLLIWLCGCETSSSIQPIASPTDVEEPSIISHYHGSTTPFNDISVYYDIKTCMNEDISYYITYDFEIAGKQTKKQTITYDIPDGFMPDTVSQGLLIVDANNDGYSDVLMDLGFYSHFARSVCLVYEPIQNEFVIVPDFDNLYNPRLILGADNKKYFVADEYWQESTSASEYKDLWHRYEINHTDLTLIAKLTEYTSTTTTSVLYNEEYLLNGAWMQTTIASDDISLSNWFLPLFP